MLRLNTERFPWEADYYKFAPEAVCLEDSDIVYTRALAPLVGELLMSFRAWQTLYEQTPFQWTVEMSVAYERLRIATNSILLLESPNTRTNAIDFLVERAARLWAESIIDYRRALDLRDDPHLDTSLEHMALATANANAFPKLAWC